MKKDLYVAKSRIGGEGVFTTSSFKKREIIFILKGKIKRYHIRNSRDSVMNPNWVGLEKDAWIDPDGVCQSINHSCDPNMGIKGRVEFVALRNIKKGEELTFDYSITEEDIFWKFKCNCGSKKCRRVLYSIQSLSLPVFKRYLPYIPNYFQKVYNRCNHIKKMASKHG